MKTKLRKGWYLFRKNPECHWLAVYVNGEGFATAKWIATRVESAKLSGTWDGPLHPADERLYEAQKDHMGRLFEKD